MRRLKNPAVAEFLALSVLISCLSYFVSVFSVLDNMWVSENSYQYFLSAFSGADLLVQMVLIAIGVVGLFLVGNTPVYFRLRQRLAL
jgi:ABC-type arginine/histidine transport system permease subunit